eukprot:scaffold73230_cov63-Phaeocystis_antarctica.AAC.1
MWVPADRTLTAISSSCGVSKESSTLSIGLGHIGLQAADIGLQAGGMGLQRGPHRVAGCASSDASRMHAPLGIDHAAQQPLESLEPG